MKTAVGVVFTAALGAALPHVDRSTTTLSSCDTDATNESKLPWIVYKGTSGPCQKAFWSSADRQDFEEACGTEGFCDIFNPEHGPDSLKQMSEKYGYANNTECYAGHAKMPWVEYKQDFGACRRAIRSSADREDFEEACGTEEFCDMFNPEYGPDSLKPVLERWGKYGYTTKTECFAGHSKKPWVEYKQNSGACMQAVNSGASREKFEAACGTEAFCDLFNAEYGPDSLKQMTGQYGYATIAECIADHEPKP